jgi:hypothetical protein
LHGEIKAAAPVDGKVSRSQSGTAGRNSASRAAFSGKARKFKDRSGTMPSSSPGSPTIAHRGAHFGCSIAE